MQEEMGSIICWCNHTATELGDLSSVSEVGVGLFLALTVVQFIGSGGMAKLRRKAQSISAIVTKNNMTSERESVGRMNGELLRLELGLESLSSSFFYVSFGFVIVALIGLAVISLAATVTVNCYVIAGILTYYLALPVVAFVIASRVINRRCDGARRLLSEVEDRVLSKL